VRHPSGISHLSKKKEKGLTKRKGKYNVSRAKEGKGKKIPLNVKIKEWACSGGRTEGR